MSGALSLTPAVQYDRANASFGARGTWVRFESGNNILQLTTAAAWLSNPGGRWRTELSGSFGLGRYDEADDSYGHLFARSRMHYVGRRSGAWGGLATGISFGDYSGHPVEVGVGWWSVLNRLGFAASVTTTVLGGGQYVDLMAATRWTQEKLRIDMQVGARGFSGGEGSGGYGEITTSYQVNSRLALTASGGRYRTDPARGVLGAKYLNVGLSFGISGTGVTAVPTISRALAAVDSELEGSAYASPARLEVHNASSGGVLILRVPNASRVEVMGDFTDWLPVSLLRIGESVWELRDPVPEGVHRLNIRIDGGPWLVPIGARLEENEFGGAVGIVVIPSLGSARQQ